VKGKEDLEWLKLDVEPGAIHDHAAFQRAIPGKRLLDRIESDLRRASELIEEPSIVSSWPLRQHVSVWVKARRSAIPTPARTRTPDEQLNA